MTGTVKWPEQLTMDWLREQYAAKRITPAEVVAEVIRRSSRDEAMNIWITPPSAELIQPYLDQLSRVDAASSLLWGIPFAIKDNIDLAGVPTTAGCETFAYTPDSSAAVVQRLIDAGAIPIGKTNLDQFATGLVGTRSPYGETHNALREELISGGSSSGSAVAVARGQAVFSLGTDTAGSGRVPAALNGLVGYKPSLGAWPTKGVVPACASLDCVTVFTHSLNDALAVDLIARGPEATDPWSRNIPQPLTGQLPSKLCVPIEAPAFYGPFAPAYREAWELALDRVSELGIALVEIELDLFNEAASILYGGPWVAERWADLGAFVEANPSDVFPVTEQVLRTGASPVYTAASVFQAAHRLQALRLAAHRLLEDAVLVLPTCGGTWSRDEVRDNPIATNSDMGRYTNHCNLLDLCAVALQAGEADADLPFGITMFATAVNETLLCSTAKRFVETEASAETSTEAGDSIAVSEAVPNAISEAVPDAIGGTRQVTVSSNTETMHVAVCGLHMRGFPLEKQMQACGAVFVRETESAPKYKLVKLPTTPAKPGMIKQEQGGSAITLEVWEMPIASFGAFVAGIPAPLGIGKVELADGTEVSGFICEAYIAGQSEDITAAGSWRNFVHQ
ncbi:allophanate hydrolase [Paenibacillus sp. OV219]|uniref:allophanate hydrolase n=1 Tax=Paenibacillus sp. OV219 TaxID=1884377 RepID=UPI0008C0642E|nr:allophanate hydrolase [Paenibacillus sp. OV219]SEM88332.1 allophanate hydrolase [Paenibacillus sp. OV219]